jgi:hypothetical protein
MQIIILGMHRSGTSVVAGLVNLMGAYFAPTDIALPPDMTNPKGYWERKDVIIANKNLMESTGATWHQLSQWAISQATAEQKNIFQRQVTPILQDLNQHPHWLLKDPRLCLTLPLWQPLLDNPIYVIVHRNPIQIAQSLQKRNQFNLHTGLALWEKHILTALQAIQDKPKVLISFHDLVQNPLEITKNLYQSIENHHSGLKIPSDADIINFVQPNYMHQRGNQQLLKAYANQQQLDLMQQFEQQTIFHYALPQLSEGAQSALQQHDLFHQQQQQLQQVLNEKQQFQYWLDSLSGDIQAIFNSYTWRWSESLVNIINGKTAKDNIQRILAEYRDWKN